MARKRNNLNNWLVAYDYSYVWGRRRWKVWQPNKYCAEFVTFETADDAYKWISRRLLFEEMEITRNAQIAEDEIFRFPRVEIHNLTQQAYNVPGAFIQS